MRLRERRGCEGVSGGRAAPRRLRLRLQAALKEATRKMTLCQRLLERDKTLELPLQRIPGIRTSLSKLWFLKKSVHHKKKY